ncbi:MAG: Cell envelope-related transcriptional attenuator [Candidatus Uhrbacteria bacterium GW2011_GWE2_45_35]|uniref:Cell envelope-related transcriptional attenuator n=2 Tax=Candidatus Uhriibacteriota TaxID=1752732 RepID=A0A0G1LMT5_9BACT|nr:MAG: Cell envelope-related transcriptional attenuator [Candidatus Uhrbacteria bacterium GW2011_GWF2_44_350]KKU06860.1 MAG: Cell envelope-related transcriptional attenuator [Candidatus Uhrbacteria bacterium GW2011_GWE2_45_35]HBR80765.1 hypothetical protein [Candidatus Uhrbacteria bacterium]HCU31781.1 hypothetical protein [Candidatus Uhrbacteria bacterium]
MSLLSDFENGSNSQPPLFSFGFRVKIFTNRAFMEQEIKKKDFRIKRWVLLVFAVVLVGLGAWLTVRAAVFFVSWKQEKVAHEVLEQQIQEVIDNRLTAQEAAEATDTFGDDGIVRILFIGLDSRSGSAVGHCDAIQFVEIDKNKETVNITAVPRGTYSPLPGSGHLPSDYYVSNACEIGGLDYGIEQIEKILGQKADYVAMIGFSEALGVFRLLKLPTTETLQWLRLRQSYAIGEPQRAHNHSTFLKQLLVKFVPDNTSSFDVAWEYLLYQLVETDLSFGQAQEIITELSAMNLSEQPEKIILSMKPAYLVFDISYDPEHLEDYLSARLDPVSDRIPEGAYTGISEPEAQQKLMDLINAGLEDTEFVKLAFEQKIWLQLDDEGTRETVHFAVLEKYLEQVSDTDEVKNLLADYVLEMELDGQTAWAEAGRNLLAKEIND